MEALFTSTFTVAIAEIGDKTQLLALLLAARFRNKSAIILGIFLSTLINHFAAAWLGQFAFSWLDPQWARYLIAASFFAIAIWVLVPDKMDDDDNRFYKLGAFAATFILFFIALEMILGITLYKQEEGSNMNASVFPLAFPLIAGPGSLTTLLSLKSEFHTENIIIAVIVNVLVIFIVLKTSNRIERFIGQNGIDIIRKVFGVVLLAIAVKLFTTNIKFLL